MLSISKTNLSITFIRVVKQSKFKILYADSLG